MLSTEQLSLDNKLKQAIIFYWGTCWDYMI